MQNINSKYILSKREGKRDFQENSLCRIRIRLEMKKKIREASFKINRLTGKYSAIPDS